MAPVYIYLHGFNSSPASHKAQQFKRAISQMQPQARVVIPELSPWPAQAMQQIEALVADVIPTPSAPLVFLGSSLGGYYATYLAQKYAVPAILINPAVRPYELLATMLGRQQNMYTQEVYQLTGEHMQQLIDLEVQNLTVAKQLLVLLQTDDEVLDYRLAAQTYVDAELDIEPGGDHGYQNFEQRISQILAFVARQSKP
ncbi:MAG TPA: esterase YqiA [Oceanospirillaceae bacterium]|nr:esterase YqiA [Oceanospirillaceae bacterium]